MLKHLKETLSIEIADQIEPVLESLSDEFNGLKQWLNGRFNELKQELVQLNSREN